MRSRRNHHRLQLEQLEDRCTPGSVLDPLSNPLLADPLPAPLGGGHSSVLLEGTETAVSLLVPGDQTIAMPSQAACPAGQFSPGDSCLPGPFGLPVATELRDTPPPRPGDTGADAIVLAAASLSQGQGAPPTAGNVVSAFAGDAQGVRVLWGESTIIDGARVATWALVSPQDNTILAAGVTFSLKLAENMPEPGPGPAGAIASLAFPALVRETTFFNHLEIQPEPHGHEAAPGSVNPDRNRVPHFDFHFYGIPEEQVWAIPDLRPPLPAVPADRLPAGYTQPGRSVLQMGRHSNPAWALTDPNPLSTIMIAGYLPDGSQMHFLEPMISQDVLLGRQDFSLPVPRPQTFGREMLYPSTFRAMFQGNAYSFVFSDFVRVQ